MTDYDGTSFVGMDDDALGDGHDTTLPLDTYVQWRIQGNLEHIAAEPRMLCFSPVIANSDDFTTVTGLRPYTHAVSQGSVFFWDMWLIPDQTGVDITVCYSSFIVTGGGAGNTEYECVITSPEGALVIARETGTLPETETAGSPNTPYVGVTTIAADFDNPIRQRVLARVWFFVNATADTEAQATALDTGTSAGTDTGYGWDNKVYCEDATIFVDSPLTGHPTSTSRECMFIEFDPTTVSGIPDQDILTLIQRDAAGTVEKGALTRTGGIPVTMSTTTTASRLDFELKTVKSFFLRAVAVQHQFDYGSFESSRVRFEPHIPVRMSAGLFQHSAMIDIHKRRRLIAVGPRGVMDVERAGYYDKGYAAHWPFTLGDDTGIDQVLIDDSMYLTTEDPELEVQMTFICVQNNAMGYQAFNSPNSGSNDRGIGARARDNFLDDPPLAGKTGRILWDITVDLDQMDNQTGGSATWSTDSTSYLSQTEDVLLKLNGAAYGVQGVGLPSVASGMNAAAFGNKETDPRNDNFWHKEGTLFGEDISSGYLQTVKVLVPVSGTDENTNALPYRFKITAAIDTLIEAVTGDTANVDTGTIQLMLVSYSVHEVPTEQITASAAIDPPTLVAESGDIAYVGVEAETS